MSAQNSRETVDWFGLTRGQQPTQNRDGQLVWSRALGDLSVVVALVFDAPGAADRTTPRQIQTLASNWLEAQRWVTDRHGRLRHGKRRLAQLVAYVNNELKQLNRQEGCSRFLSTLTAALVAGDQVWVISVGDSPFAHLRIHEGGEFDYSPSAEDAIFSGPYGRAHGTIEPQPTASQPRFVGEELFSAPLRSVETFQLEPGDWFFLMSDGLGKQLGGHRALIDLAMNAGDLSTLQEGFSFRLDAKPLTDDVTLVAIRARAGLRDLSAVTGQELETHVARELEKSLPQSEELFEQLSQETWRRSELLVQRLKQSIQKPLRDISSSLRSLEESFEERLIRLEVRLQSMEDGLAFSRKAQRPEAGAAGWREDGASYHGGGRPAAQVKPDRVEMERRGRRPAARETGPGGEERRPVVGRLDSGKRETGPGGQGMRPVVGRPDSGKQSRKQRERPDSSSSGSRWSWRKRQDP